MKENNIKDFIIRSPSFVRRFNPEEGLKGR
jgi:hypothetical protein